MTEEQKLQGPSRVIAAYTTVRVMPSEKHIEIVQNDVRVELTIEAAFNLITWLERAGVVPMPDDLWPGIEP